MSYAVEREAKRQADKRIDELKEMIRNPNDYIEKKRQEIMKECQFYTRANKFMWGIVAILMMTIIVLVNKGVI